MKFFDIKYRLDDGIRRQPRANMAAVIIGCILAINAAAFGLASLSSDHHYDIHRPGNNSLTVNSSGDKSSGSGSTSGGNQAGASGSGSKANGSAGTSAKTAASSGGSTAAPASPGSGGGTTSPAPVVGGMGGGSGGGGTNPPAPPCNCISNLLNGTVQTVTQTTNQLVN